MKLFSFRMRAISTFIVESGMSTRRCFDPQALRMRVNMSAIGSVMLMVVSLSPARLRDARDQPVQRQLTEADAADAELPNECARPAAALAAVVLPHLELRLALALLDHGFTRHYDLSSLKVSPAWPATAGVANITCSPRSACSLPRGTACPARAAARGPGRPCSCS